MRRFGWKDPGFPDCRIASSADDAEHARPRRMLRSARQELSGAWGLGNPCAPWPLDPDLDFTRVRTAWERTRRSLTVIIADEGIEDVVLAIECETPALRLAAESPITRASEFRLVPGELARPLESHLHTLFAMTAVAGLWTDFFVCAECGRYGLLRHHPRGDARERCFCTDTCRYEWHRADRTTVRRDREAEIAADLRRFTTEGMGWLEACARAGVSSRRGEALTQRAITHGQSP